LGLTSTAIALDIQHAAYSEIEVADVSLDLTVYFGIVKKVMRFHDSHVFSVYGIDRRHH